MIAPPSPARPRQRLARTIVRGALSLCLAAGAATCIVRGLGRLFAGGASYGGVGAALGYFVAGVLLLLAAGEAYPKASPSPVAPGAAKR